MPSNKIATTSPLKQGSSDDAGSLQRGLRLLEVLQNATRPLTATELAEAARQPLSTVHRLLLVLMQNDYVYRTPSKRYFAGPRALVPLNVYHPLNALRREARDHLRLLRERFRQTSSIIVFLGTQRLVLDLTVESESFSPYFASHLTSPVYASASGKVLLAYVSRSEKLALLGDAPLIQRTPNTITDRAALDAQLETVRQQGYALAIDENRIGHSAAAAPIHASPTHVVGCFVLAGLTHQNFTQANAELIGQALKSTAALFAAGSTAVRQVAVLAGVDLTDSHLGIAPNS